MDLDLNTLFLDYFYKLQIMLQFILSLAIQKKKKFLYLSWISVSKKTTICNKKFFMANLGIHALLAILFKTTQLISHETTIYI